MRITITCPRCKQSMSVAPTMAGSYATCAHCRGRLWVAEHLAGGSAGPGARASPPGVAPAGTAGPKASDSGPAEAVQRAAPPTVGPSPPPPAGPPARPIPRAPAPPAGPPPAPHAPTAGAIAPGAAPPAPELGKRVARFITAEAAQSTLNLAADGKLPELHLQETGQARAKDEKGTTVHPLVLLALLSLSVVACIVLVLIEPEASSSSHSAAKQDARRVIAARYFADRDDPGPKEPYQVLLREAQRAYARRDYQEERRLYRQVLQLLRAERSKFESVTGTPAGDQELERQINVLLRDD